MPSPTRKELLNRIQQLEARLEEAEDTLRALRGGEVDAVVVESPQGDRVYTLKGAGEPYRILIESIAEGALTLTRDGRILYANEQLASMVGIPLERVIGSRIQDLVPPDDLDDMTALLGGHSGAKLELRLLTSAGAKVPVYLAVNTLPIDSEEYLCLVVTDLAEQKRNEEIVDAERVARSILDQVARPIVVAAPDGRIIRASRSADRLAGKPVVLSAFDDVFPLRFGDGGADYPFPLILSDAQRTGGVESLAVVSRMPDGRIVDLMLSAAPLYCRDSELLGCILTLGNITELKRLEDSRRESEARERNRAAELQAIMDAAPAGILVAHDPECRTITGNRSAHDLMRIPEGRNLSMTAPEGERPRHFRIMKNGREIPTEELPMQATARTGKAAPEFEHDLEYDDGTSCTVLGRAGPVLDETGRPRGAVAVFVDITDRKLLDDRLRDAQKMESIGILAGGVAHDFNNLLTGIMGNASLVLEFMPRSDPNRENLESLIESAGRAADLTRQLLAYAGKGRFLISRVDVSQLVQKMRGLLRSSVPATAEIRFDLEEKGAVVEADPGQIQQILTNLVLNASEALGGSLGEINVRTRVRSVDESFIRQAHVNITPGTYVALEVSDTGCGMDTGTLQRIFEPFFTTKFQGRGLGLSAVQGIVNAHHGAIVVYSHPGKGSLFTVLLPVAVAAAQPSQAARTVVDVRDLYGHGTILVVDDEPSVRHVAKTALEHYGYTVLLAENGAGALDVLHHFPQPVSLVLLDLTMPGMTGEEAFRRIRELRPEVPVLLSSGYNQIEAIRRFSGLPLAGFIGKPYSAKDLAAKVKSLCAP